MSEIKYREFKISNNAEEDYIEEIKTAAYAVASFFEDLHVIEGKAYIDLKKQNQKLKSLMSVQLDMQEQIKKSDAREKLLLDVISELKRAVNCDYDCKTNQDNGWMKVECNCGAQKTLSNAAKKLEGS